MSIEAHPKPGIEICKEFRPIPVAAIRAMDSLGMNLYCLPASDSKPTLFYGERHTQSAKQLAEVCDSKHKVLLLRKQDFLSFSRKMYDLLNRVLEDDSTTRETKFALLQIAYADKFEQHFRKSTIEKYLSCAQEAGLRISSLIQQGEVSAQSIYKQVHRNSSHYSQVTNVAAYAVILAKTLDMASPEQLDRIAIGCLLHDVGKLYLREELLTKKGRLSPHDHEELNRVPLLSYETLSDFPQLELSQLLMIYQQSERLDGTGYPVRIMAEEIHPWARLLAIAVSFNAITSDRAFRPALSLHEGLNQLADNANTHFDPEMVLCWISAFRQQ